MHQARAEEITLKEDFVSVPMPLDDDFGIIEYFDFHIEILKEINFPFEM